MNINNIRSGNVSYIVIDDLYNDDEVSMIKSELISLLPIALPPDFVSAARNQFGKVIKRSKGIFLEEHYDNNLDRTRILKINRKLFCKEIIDEAIKLDQYFYAIKHCNSHSTLVNFYRDGDFYKSHYDISVLTAVTLFSLGDISGGDLVLTEANEVIKFRENRVIIFPGCVPHHAESVIAADGSYRVSMVQFLNYAI